MGVFDSPYDEGYGPSMARSIKRLDGRPSDHNKVRRGPSDLMRSQRIGTSRFVCIECGAVRADRVTIHRRGCKTLGKFKREVTKP